MTHETKYALSDDVSIAYQVTGCGPLDLVWAPGTVSHLDLDWDYSPKARFIEKLGSFCRLIRFDKRGTGLSDRPTEAATLEERTDDIRTVMDSAGSARATILGMSEGVNMACVFAASYPQRTRSLVLWGGQARWVRTDDYPWGATLQEYERHVERTRATWPSREYFTGSGAGLGPDADEAQISFWLRYGPASASPASVVALEHMNMEIDTRDILPTIRVPTLVMNRTEDPIAHVEAGRDLAAHIPGARFIELPGNSHSMYEKEPDRILAATEEFVTGSPSTVAQSADRFLATILFTDIVGSTQRAARIGDRRWRDLIAAHDALARRAVTRQRGQVVRSTGDGFLATFDGPGRAIRCAPGIRDEVRQLGIEIRAGLHSGEIEPMGADMGGIAVYIAARVSALATANQVWVSRTVRDLVAGSGFNFQERGVHHLKGVAGEWRLFSVEA